MTDEVKKNNRVAEAVSAAIAGVLVTLVTLALLFALVHAGDANRAKVVRLTENCMSHGHAGFSDADKHTPVCVG